MINGWAIGFKICLLSLPNVVIFYKLIGSLPIWTASEKFFKPLNSEISL